MREKPDAVLGRATGSTPELLYAELIRMHKEEGLDFSQITTFNLDEASAADLKLADYCRWVYNNKPDGQKDV